MSPFAASLSRVGMLIRPPKGDQAARPVSSYRMIRKFGAPSGAFLGVYGVQSCLESRTSSFIVPLNSPGGAGSREDCACCGGACAKDVNASAAPSANLRTDPPERQALRL